jgi:carnitine-CoA ligase
LTDGGQNFVTKSLLLPNRIEEHASTDPESCAVHSVGQGWKTWGEVWRDSLQWAAALEHLGVAPGDRVVTMMPQSHEAHAAWTGSALLGALEVPTNTFFRGAWLDHVLVNSAAKLVVISEQYLSQFLPSLPSAPQVETVVVYDQEHPAVDAFGVRVIGGPEFLDGASEPARRQEVQPWDIAAVLYTSGTTGPSKGVLYPWAQLLHTQGSVEVGDDPSAEVFYLPFGPYHASGKEGLTAAAHFGARAVVRGLFSRTHFWEDVRAHGVTSAMMVGAMANILYKEPPTVRDRDHGLRRIMMAPLIPEIDNFKERFGVSVYAIYGSTELGNPFLLPSGDANSSTWKSCGQLRPCYEARIVDENDMEVAAGQVGELIIRSSEPWLLNQGYLGMPEQSFRAWRNGWYHTGDGFYQDGDGRYYFHDRLKDALRRRGENISALEVEAAINAFSKVVESAVIGVPSSLGEDDIMVVVKIQEGVEFGPDELTAFLEPVVPRFVLPRFVRVVEEFPKTGTGRIRKIVLREEGVTEDTWDAMADQLTV